MIQIIVRPKGIGSVELIVDDSHDHTSIAHSTIVSDRIPIGTAIHFAVEGFIKEETQRKTREFFKEEK